MGPIPQMNPWVNGAVSEERTRCFVTGIVVVKPDVNRFQSRVSFKAEPGYASSFEGSMEVLDGSQYRVGDVIWVTTG